MTAPATTSRPPTERTHLHRSDRVSVLTGVFAVGLAYFLAVEPSPGWVPLALAVLMGIGMDGILRGHMLFGGPAIRDTIDFLLLPVLYALGACYVLEDAVSGYWSIGAAGGAALLFGAVVYSQMLTLTPEDPLFLSARLLVSIATYVTGFMLFAALYLYEADLAPAAVLAGCVATLLAVEVLREAEAAPGETVLYAAVAGVIVGELRWCLHFLPVDGYLAALLLLLTLYVVAEMLRSHLVGHLTWAHGIEYLSVAGIGVAVVVAARILGS